MCRFIRLAKQKLAKITNKFGKNSRKLGVLLDVGLCQEARKGAVISKIAPIKAFTQSKF
jgi:hypothetical protein